jgi:hypothetical protein
MTLTHKSDYTTGLKIEWKVQCQAQSNIKYEPIYNNNEGWFNLYKCLDVMYTGYNTVCIIL